MSEAEYGVMSRAGAPRTQLVRSVASIVLMSSGLIAASSQQMAAITSAGSSSVPATCGAIGAAAYEPEPVDIPAVDTSQRGRIITVTSTSDTIDGDTSSVEALAADPGPDGTSLREAIQATNRDPGISTINFSSSLQGATIAVSPLPELAGGNVFINGDIDGDDAPDVTIQGSSPDDSGEGGQAFGITSSGNMLHALSLRNFYAGVRFLPVSTDGVYADNVISNLVMNAIGGYGIDLVAFAARNRWVNTMIIGNTMRIDHSLARQASFGGVHLPLFNDASDSSLETTTIANNTIRISRGGTPKNISVSRGSQGIYIAAGSSGASRSEARDTLVANNSITMTNGAGADGDFGINVHAGGIGGHNNLVDGLRIVENQITMPPPGAGIAMQLTSSVEVEDTYAEGNVMRAVSILGNTIEGPGMRAIDLGKATGKSNVLSDVSILGNRIAIGPAGGGLHNAILIEGGSRAGSQPGGDNEASSVVAKYNTLRLVKPFVFGSQPNRTFDNSAVRILGGSIGARRNRVSEISITKNIVDGGGAFGIVVFGGISSNANRVSTTAISCNLVRGGTAGNVSTGGVAILGGFDHPDHFGVAPRDNVVRNVRVSRNSIESPSAGIRIIGGLGSKARQNRVVCVPLRGNRIDATKKLSVRSNLGGAAGNRARLSGC